MAFCPLSRTSSFHLVLQLWMPRFLPLSWCLSWRSLPLNQRTLSTKLLFFPTLPSLVMLRVSLSPLNCWLPAIHWQDQWGWMHAVGNAGPKVLFHLTSSLLLPSRALPHLFMQLLSMLSPTVHWRSCWQQYFNYKAQAEATVNVELRPPTENRMVHLWVTKSTSRFGTRCSMRSRYHVRLFFGWFGWTYTKPSSGLQRTYLPNCQHHKGSWCVLHLVGVCHSRLVLFMLFKVTFSTVTFSADGKLTLTLSWGWSICDADLSAMV